MLIALPLLGALPRGGGAFYADAPPPAHTGGFGEPSCRTCHFDNPVNEPKGRLAVTGLPERYVPGEHYELHVELTRPGLERGGFQLAIRYLEGKGRQAGGLRTSGEANVATVTEAGGVRYAHHAAAGTRPDAPGTARWTLQWEAPADGAPVILHVAANAANGDQSEFGDHIYVRADTLRAGPAPDSGSESHF